MLEILTISTVHDLRRRWNPHKERLAVLDGEQPTSIRFHRACSWMARVEQLPDGPDHDLALVALDRLQRPLRAVGLPEAGAAARPRKLAAVCGPGSQARQRRPRPGCASGATSGLVMALFDDEYVSGYYWQEPSAERGRKARRSACNAQTWYIEERWPTVLDEILARIYLMRCQLVHGAATYGGKLNRTSLKHCVTMMQKLLPALLAVWIDHGADEDWGPMCYPPMGALRGPIPGHVVRPRIPRGRPL